MKVRFFLIVVTGLALTSALFLSSGLTLAMHPVDVLAQDDTTPMVTLTYDGVVRAWPSTETDALGIMPSRSSVPVNARTADYTWWQIPYANGPEGNGWLPATVVRFNEAAMDVQVVEVVLTSPTPMPATPTPTPPPCQYNAAFVADVTFPDGTQVAPAQAVNKVWRLRNTGACTWDTGTVLAFTGGFQMSAPGTVTFPATAPGATVDIGTTMYAPSSPGTYKGAWQLKSADGQFFGGPVTVVIQVPSPVTPTPVPPPPPTPRPAPPPPPPAPPKVSIEFWADKSEVLPDGCTTVHWKVSNASKVEFNRWGLWERVSDRGSEKVCPDRTSTYELRVRDERGESHSRSVKVKVMLLK